MPQVWIQVERAANVTSILIKRIYGGGVERISLGTNPSPVIMAKGIGGVFCSQYFIEDDGKPAMKTDPKKPLYCIPTMQEVREIPWNGLTVASTFSGAGGSCTGYRMAGFRVIWANEFVPRAKDSYRANKSEHCILDGRDIREVKAEEILDETGINQGELDLFDGSPPCQAFSTAGKREKCWGKKKKYEHGASQCNEQLFDEYIRLLRGLMPKTFVVENVSGLIKGKAKGFFLEILRDLKASEYKVSCRVLDAQWLGVPQTRRRVIFIGVRDDVPGDPSQAYPKPLGYRYSVRDALPWIHESTQDPQGQWPPSTYSNEPHGTIPCSNFRHIKIQELSPSRRKKNAYNLEDVKADKPCPTVTIASPGNDLAVPNGPTKRKFTIEEVKRICAFPDDFILIGSYAQQWERLGNSVPPLMMKAIAESVRDAILLPYDMELKTKSEGKP